MGSFVSGIFVIAWMASFIATEIVAFIGWGAGGALTSGLWLSLASAAAASWACVGYFKAYMRGL